MHYCHVFPFFFGSVLEICFVIYFVANNILVNGKVFLGLVDAKFSGCQRPKTLVVFSIGLKDAVLVIISTSSMHFVGSILLCSVIYPWFFFCSMWSAAVDALTAFIRCFITPSSLNNGIFLQPVLVYLSRYVYCHMCFFIIYLNFVLSVAVRCMHCFQFALLNNLFFCFTYTYFIKFLCDAKQGFILYCGSEGTAKYEA